MKGAIRISTFGTLFLLTIYSLASVATAKSPVRLKPLRSSVDKRWPLQSPTASWPLHTYDSLQEGGEEDEIVLETNAPKEVDLADNFPKWPPKNYNGYYPFRGKRPFEVPQIECPPAADGIERYACPSPDETGRYLCIDDHVLCDGYIDCPNEEDEESRGCLFYRAGKAHVDVIADALLRWARGR